MFVIGHCTMLLAGPHRLKYRDRTHIAGLKAHFAASRDSKLLSASAACFLKQLLVMMHPRRTSSWSPASLSHPYNTSSASGPAARFTSLAIKIVISVNCRSDRFLALMTSVIVLQAEHPCCMRSSRDYRAGLDLRQELSSRPRTTDSYCIGSPIARLLWLCSVR